MRFVSGGDDRLLPVEKPEGRTYLAERLEGRQIARLQYILTPAEEWGAALELTSRARCIFWAAEDHDARRYRWRIVMRWMPPLKIVTSKVWAHFTQDRHRALAGEEPPDDLQKYVEGEWIIGAAPTYEPNGQGGETIILELRGGAKLRFDALPPRREARPKIRADFAIEYIKPPSVTTLGSLIVTP